MASPNGNAAAGKARGVPNSDQLGGKVGSDSKPASEDFQDRKRPATDAAGPCTPVARRAIGRRKLKGHAVEGKPETAIAAAMQHALAKR